LEENRSLNHLLGITKGLNAANYIFWLHGLQPAIQATPEQQNKGPTSGDKIAINDVHFSYPLRPDTPALKGVCIKVSHRT
jgi:ATP-binding cassette subfamily B (MDR/TAP) protein 1